MSKVKFKYGTAEQLANAPYLEGTFYVISDDNSTDGILYADLHGNRICFGDVASLVKKVSKLESSAQDTKFEVDWLRSNVIKNTIERDTTITADDVHTVPPQEVVIYGKSEQNGTPTPVTPVSIDSLDNKFTLHVAKNGITDYGDWPIMFDLGSYILRSLPDGTCDTLRMSYSKPSEDAGWAMYDTTLEQTIASIALADLEWTQLSNGVFQGKNIPNSANGVIGTHQILCDIYQEIETQSNSADMIGNDDKTIAFQSDYPYIFVKDTDYTNLDDFIASLGTSVITYPLATPIVHSLETVEFLGTVELPVLPNPMTAWVDDGNVQPDISMTYEVDNKIFSSNLIHAETDVSLDDIRDRISALENIDEILTNRLTATEADIDSLEVTKANIDSLEAAEARIDELEVSSATIQNLEATNARIGDLETDSLRVKNRLTAAEADIGNLEAINVNVIGRLRATEADIEELTASKATVDDLIAVNANIQELEAANATITGKLTAAQASIEDLEAENATITGTLTAAQASIEDLEATNATITGRLEANEASIEDLEATNVTITGRLEANEADIDTLTASKADITDLNAATARIGSLETDNVDVKGRLSATEADIENLEATTATIESLNAAEARIGTLETDKANVTDLTAATGRIGTLEANTADINTIRANSAKVANLTAQELEADHATIGSLDANYAQINMANVNNAWIQNGTVKDGAISNAMINSVSANKLTAGTIDASNITVTNLNADNITTGTINGQRIGAGSLSLDKLEENVYTEDEVNSIVDNLQNQIDGAIETWTGTEVPTLSNTPASDWTTNSIKDKHVGDIYFIVNSQSDQNGYNYRFTKIGNTYSWQLIKDSDVTQVLQRLTDAEGKIGNIKQFDTTISSWKNDTDEELSSIKSAATTLAGRVTTAEGTLQTKVDTTTFNTLSQTVDGHSSSISQLTTETTTLTQAVDTLNTKTSSDSGNIIQFDNSIGFKEIAVHGKSIQASYTGKNLLELHNESNGSRTAWTYTTLTNEEVTGTYSGSVSVFLCAYKAVLKAGTYTFSAKTITNLVQVYVYTDTVPGNRIAYGSIVNNKMTFTVSNDGTYYIGLYRAGSSSAGEISSVIRPQLELGSTATDYEPYVGGKSAPNPDYPQEINSIDNLMLNVCGKNLLPKSEEATRTYRGMTFSTTGNGEVVISGTFTTGSNDVSAPCGTNGFGINANYYAYVEIQENYAIYLPAGTYTFSATITNRAGAGQAVIVIGNIGQTVMTGASYKGIISGREPQTFTTTGGFAMLVVGTTGNVATVDTTISNIQLELGSTATDYEPYQGQLVDIPLSDYQIRSLPDGTEDTLAFNYIGPSIREGWGLYNTELVQYCKEADMGELAWAAFEYNNVTLMYTILTDMLAAVPNLTTSLCDTYKTYATLPITSLSQMPDLSCAPRSTFKQIYIKDSNYTDAVTFKAAVTGAKLIYPLAEPIVHDLGVVELPLSENLNLWASTSPSTTIDATWWHEAGKAEKNEIDIINNNVDLNNTIDLITLDPPYKEVEWVESDGHQFVQLDWIPNKNGQYGFELDFENYNTWNATAPAWTDSAEVNRTKAGFILGARNAANGAIANQFTLGCYNPGYFFVGTSTNYDPKMYHDGRRQQCSYRNGIYTAPDGTTKEIPCGTVSPNWGMVIFALSNNATKSSYYYPSSTKLYSCKFYDDDILAVDLVGAIRVSDNMTGLYDKVANKFWACAGLKTGNIIGDLGTSLSLLEQSQLISPVVMDTKTVASRLWTADAPTIQKLEDGQQITYRVKYPSVSEAQPVELINLNDAGASANVYLKLTLKDKSTTDWIPCYYLGGTRLTTHYGVGTDVRLTYHENRVFSTSAIANGWWADANYNTNDNTTYTKYSNSVIAGLNGLKRYTLCMKDQNGNWTSIINENNTWDTLTCYTGGLQLDTILYYSTTTAVESGANSGDGLWESYGIIDWRYSMNVANNATKGLIYRKPLYLVGTLNNDDGLFYLDQTKWWTQTPDDPDKIYIWVSAGYTNYYQGILSVQNPVYTYDEDAGLIEINVSRYTRTATKLNETIDTVDEHTRKIGVLETTVENKADGSDLTTISNRLNTVSDTVDGHTQSISSLNTTMATKADSSSVETVSNRVNSISDTVDGHTQSISSINSTVATKADSSTVTTLSNNVNSISETVDGHTQSISSLNTTVATKADGSALTTVSNKVNTISDTVDEHSQSISSINTTLDTKADGSALTTVSNKLNTVSDTVDGHTQSISSINETLETKVDSSTVSSLTTKVNNISDTVDGHTQTIGSVQNTQTQMQGKLNKTIVETTQLWYSKANTEAPAKPTSQITSTSTDGNAWRIVVPVYNASYPNYFYCYQWKYTDGTYGWSGVTRDIATGESQERARTAITDASSAVSTAASAQATAESASTNANQAKENASSAVSLANTASTNASSALSTANTASSNASTALSTANSAASDASSAVSTANTAKATADKNVKTSLQLWFTKANETAPNKPTAKVTSTSTDGNAWRVVVPTYSASYPYYFYCYQYELADGTYTWSDVVYDRATTENQSNSRNAVTGVSTLTTKTNTISDTVDQHSQSISSLNTTIATKADNSTVTTLSNNLSTLEQDVNTFKTTVSSTYSTKNELAEVQDDISDLQAGSKLSDTKSGNIITIDDALEAPFIDVAIYGKSMQNIYSGKNLLDPSLYNNVTVGNNTYYTTNTDGSINVLLADQRGNNYVQNTLTLPAGTYTVSRTKAIGNWVVTRVSDYATIAGGSAVGATKSLTFTLDTETEIFIKLSFGVASNNYPFKTFIQLETGNAATSYEPYTNKKPAPSPDYPQEINSVDDLTLHITGKNLCGGDFLRDSVQNAMPQATTGTDDAGDYIRFTGAMAQYGPTIVSGMFKPDTQYTFIIKYQGETAGNVTQLSVVYTDGTSQGPIKTGITAGTVTTVTYVSLPNKTVDHLMSYWYSGATRIYYNECGIFEGILTETDFEAYTGKSIEIPLNNNKIRSLPSNNFDTLKITYQKPAVRDGWGVFSAELVQYVSEIADLSTLDWRYNSSYTCFNARLTQAKVEFSALCSDYLNVGSYRDLAEKTCSYIYDTYLAIRDTDYEDAATFKASLSGVELIYALADPIIHNLGTVELPILPNPLTAWAEGGSAQPEISIDYWLNNAADIVPHLLDLDAVSKNNITAIESRVHTAESTIDQHSDSIALKANSSDVYTKTETNGLIATEASNRQSAIEQSAEQINLNVSETYSTKTELSDSIKQTDTASGDIIQISGPIDNFVVDGKSEQIITTGKNLFDKSMAITGTYINSSGATASGSSNSTTPFIPVAEGQTYTVSYSSNNGAGNYLAWYSSNDISSVVGSRVDLRNVKSSTATAPSNANYARFSFTTSMLNSVQFEQGSVATDYEPYTGLKPAPSPDYPQDINSVNTIFLNVGGKNLFNKQEATNYLNWINGTYRRFPVHVPPNTKITISHDGPTKITNFYMCFAKWSGDWSGVPLSHPGSVGQSNQGTITSDETGVLYIKIYPNSEASVNTFLANYANNLQVEIGDTVSEYEEYTSIASNYIIATAFDDINDPNKNTYATNGGQPFQYDVQAGGYYTPMHRIVGLHNQIPGTYYKVSFWGKNREGTQSYSVLSNAIGNKFPSSISGYPDEWTYYEAAWRVPDSGNLEFVIYNQVYIKDFKITLAKGVIPLSLNDNSYRSLSNDIYDTLTLEYESPSTIDGWGVYRKKLLQRTKERILNGSEDWIRAGSAPFNIYYKEYDSVITNDTQTVAQIDVMSDRFKYYGPYYTGSNRSSNGIVVGGDGSTYTTICIDAREICDPTDVSTFKTWLSQNNTKIVFPLASPIVKDLGTVNLPIITEEMSTWVTSNPTTNISAEWYTNMGLGIFSKLNTDALSSRMTTAESSITQNAENINLKVSKDGVISSINQSAETVKIQASKVEIDGTAIFNSISSSVDNSINNSISSAKLVKTTQDQWYSSTSATTKSGGSWATTQPSIVAGRYIWQRQYVTYSDNTTAYLPSEAGICTQGQTDLSAYSTTSQMNSAIGMVSTALENYKTTTNDTLASLQNQLDGQIEAWYKSVDPTTSNEPASTWNTAELKAQHEGDIYYNVENGHSWRWMKSGSMYAWQQIPDSDAAAALAAAQNAQVLANSKRRIFTTTPTVPYDIGDLWVDGTSIKYAGVSKTNDQTYSESDWGVTATDDSNALDAIAFLSSQLSSSAIAATHRIYYRTATANPSLAAPTTWVEEATGNVYNQWTTKVPPLAVNTTAGQTKYLYLYTCEQRKRLDGTTLCTKVLLDENTTVIDGGSIITNSVTANQIAAGTITANEISSGAITTDKLDANAVTAAKIDATDLHVSAANIDGTITFGQLSGVQASGDYALSSNIPQNISDLNNDTGFITSASVPTKVSDLTNDSGFQTSSQVDTAITSKGYATTGYADGKASAAEQAAKSYAETQAGVVQTALNTEINQRKAQYGTSSTAAGTAAKAVTCANFELEIGNEITVKFTTANTSAAKVQLNVNSKGAKDIWVGNAVTSASNQLLWGANAYITFKYDGTQFQVIGEPRTWYGACTTAQATAAKTATITGCVVCKGAKVELAMTYANSAASPTLNVSSVGAKNIYFGTGTTQPLISNGTSWLQSNTATFTFDGAVWRTQGKTYIDANSIVTGYISADRIEAGSISGDKITGGTLAIGAFPSTTQADILNSNIHVPSTVAELTDSSSYATKTDAQGYADGKDSAIAAAAKRTDVSIAVTAINYTNNTATLQATLYIDGTATTSGVTYKWLKDGAVISGQTSRTLSVTSAMGLSHVYSCTVTYS